MDAFVTPPEARGPDDPRDGSGRLEITAEKIGLLIAEHESIMARILTVKPAAADGRSDGRRVRYVRAETAAATLRAVLALIS